MRLLQAFFKEASLLTAFVVLGALLLVSYWITENIDRSIFQEFQNSHVSVILEEEAQSDFQWFLNKQDEVVDYEMHSKQQNKEQLRKLYPELSEVLRDLDSNFFPVSATVSVKQADPFMEELDAQGGVIQSSFLHKPPKHLSQFFGVLTLVFSGLWILTLALVLYFQLERLTFREERKWSLMKMLGAKPLRVFFPIWWGQLLRILVASSLAIGLAVFVTQRFQSFFAWDWSSLSVFAWASFLFVSLFMATFVYFTLFMLRYRQVSLG